MIDNIHISRESWLKAATDELRLYFDKLGYVLPDKIRFSIGFTSRGKRGTTGGECWYPESSADGHYEIIIRADKSDPVIVLGVLVHELVHSLLPPEAKHGKDFKAVALRVGLQGQMRHAMPSTVLEERLNALSEQLGPLPHAALDFISGADVRKKQSARLLKAECAACCGYNIRITSKWAKAGLPVCPVDAGHGTLICEDIEEPEESISPDEALQAAADIYPLPFSAIALELNTPAGGQA